MESAVELKARLTAALHEIGYLKAENKRLQSISNENTNEKKLSTDKQNSSDSSSSSSTINNTNVPSESISTNKTNENRKLRLLQYELDKVKQDIQISLSNNIRLENLLQLLNSTSLIQSIQACQSNIETLQIILSNMGLLTEKHILRVMTNIQNDIGSSLEKIHNYHHHYTQEKNQPKGYDVKDKVNLTKVTKQKDILVSETSSSIYTDSMIQSLRTTIGDLVKENDGLRSQGVSLRKQIMQMDIQLKQAKEIELSLQQVNKLYQVQRNTLQNTHEELLAERLQSKHLRKLLMEANIPLYSTNTINTNGNSSSSDNKEESIPLTQSTKSNTVAKNISSRSSKLTGGKITNISRSKTVPSSQIKEKSISSNSTTTSTSFSGTPLKRNIRGSSNIPIPNENMPSSTPKIQTKKVINKGLSSSIASSSIPNHSISSIPEMDNTEPEYTSASLSSTTSSPTGSSISQEIAELISQGACLPSSNKHNLSHESSSYLFERVPIIQSVRFADTIVNDENQNDVNKDISSSSNEQEINENEINNNNNSNFGHSFTDNDIATIEIFKTNNKGVIRRTIKQYNYHDPWIDNETSNDSNTDENNESTIARIITPSVIATAIKTNYSTNKKNILNTSNSSIPNVSEDLQNNSNYRDTDVNEQGTGYVVGASICKIDPKETSRKIQTPQRPKENFTSTIPKTKAPLSPISALIQKALDDEKQVENRSFLGAKSMVPNETSNINSSMNNGQSNYSPTNIQTNNTINNDPVLLPTNMVNDSLVQTSMAGIFDNHTTSLTNESASLISPSSKNISSILPVNNSIYSPGSINNYSKDSLQHSKIMSVHKPRIPKDNHKIFEMTNDNSTTLSLNRTHGSTPSSLNASSIFALSPTTPTPSKQYGSSGSQRKLSARTTTKLSSTNEILHRSLDHNVSNTSSILSSSSKKFSK